MSEWRFVLDELPPDETLVIACNMNDAYPESLHWAAYDSEDDLWWAVRTGSDIDVTHWMPLPEPPRD